MAFKSIFSFFIIISHSKPEKRPRQYVDDVFPSDECDNQQRKIEGTKPQQPTETFFEHNVYVFQGVRNCEVTQTEDK